MLLAMIAASCISHASHNSDDVKKYVALATCHFSHSSHASDNSYCVKALHASSQKHTSFISHISHASQSHNGKKCAMLATLLKKPDILAMKSKKLH
jgi:hypothetical protein